MARTCVCTDFVGVGRVCPIEETSIKANSRNNKRATFANLIYVIVFRDYQNLFIVDRYNSFDELYFMFLQFFEVNSNDNIPRIIYSQDGVSILYYIHKITVDK